MNVNKTAILLVNWNGLQDTLDCLDSLYGCQEDNFEIFLVDNGSAISPKETITNLYPKVHYIASKVNLGFAAGNNLAIATIADLGFTYVLFLNNDTLVSPHFLRPLVQALEHNQELNAVQPCIYYAHQPKQIWSAGGKWNKWLGDSLTIKAFSNQNKLCYRDWLTGCAMMVRGTALKQLGGFNPQFFAYYEDVELSFRLNEKHNQLALVPDSVIWHKVGGSVHSLKNKEGNLSPMVHFWNWRNRIWVMKKYQSNLWLLINGVILVPQFLLTCLYFVTRGRWNKLKLTYKGFRDGIRYSIN